jgi:hypothetical protein
LKETGVLFYYLVRLSPPPEPLEAARWPGKKKEVWMELCAQAALEQDPEKLHALVEEIDRLCKRRKIAWESRILLPIPPRL